MPTTLSDVLAVVHRAYPVSLAEPWDTGIGLTCGDPAQTIGTVLLAVDVDRSVVDQAVEIGADLLFTHHPLLFRPVQSVAANTPKGGLIHRLMTSGIAHLAAHTNADRAPGGVNDALATALGLTDIRPLQAAEGSAVDKLVVFVPRAAADAVLEAVCGAGAGQIGNYSDAAFRTDGIGQFRPLPGASPVVGVVGRLEQVAETRLDLTLPRTARTRVIAALRAAHPYEEPAFDVTEVVTPDAADAGLGRIGTVAHPVSAAEFAASVAAALPATVTGARLAGDPHRLIHRVAVCGGAGGSLLDSVRTAGVDAYVTSDLSHHTTAEFVDQPTNPVLIEVSHWAGEWPWLGAAAALLRSELSVRTEVSTLRTDPWTMRCAPAAR